MDTVSSSGKGGARKFSRADPLAVVPDFAATPAVQPMRPSHPDERRKKVTEGISNNPSVTFKHQEWLKVKCVEEGSIKITVTTLATVATVLFTLSQFLDKIATLDLARELKEAEIEKVRAETEKIKKEAKSIEIENNKNQKALIATPENGSLMSISEDDQVAISKYKRKIDYSLIGDNLESVNPTVNANKEDLLETATDPLLNVYYKYGQLGYKFRPLTDKNLSGD